VVDFVGAAGPDLVDVVVDVLSESGPLAEDSLLPRCWLGVWCWVRIPAGSWTRRSIMVMG